MIHKYWNVRLHQGTTLALEEQVSEENATEEMRKAIRDGEEHVEEKVLWIWRTLSSFEEKSATCISDMLLHVSNGAYMDGVMAAKKFISHVDLLFIAADGLDQLLYAETSKGGFTRALAAICHSHSHTVQDCQSRTCPLPLHCPHIHHPSRPFHHADNHEAYHILGKRNCCVKR